VKAFSVHAEVRFLCVGPRENSDFGWHVPRHEPLAPELVRREEGGETQQVFFRFSPPGQTVVAELGYRNHLLAALTLPSVNKQEFINDLRLQLPTLFVRLGDRKSTRLNSSH